MTVHTSTQRQYGLWPSPITSKILSQGLRLNDVMWDSDGATLVWLEGRSDRGVLVSARLDGDAPRDLTDELSVRARVGYGGGDFGVGGGNVFFSSGGRLYHQSLAGGAAEAITPVLGDVASPAVSPDGRWVLYVFSFQRSDGLAIVDASGKQWPQQVATGHDFYMQPRWSPNSKQVAWIAWDHPQMPWDGTLLYVADVDTSSSGLPTLTNARVVDGSVRVAILHAEFSADGRYLSYLSDESGWHNLYLFDLKDNTTHHLTDEHEADLGEPAWVQGMRTYCWGNTSEALFYTRNERGFSSLWSFDLKRKAADKVLGLENYTSLGQPALNPMRPELAMVASASTQSPRLVTLDLSGEGKARVVKRATSENISPKALVMPQPISWTSQGSEVYGMLYLPHSERWTSTGKPPVILSIHGGPTGQSGANYRGDFQFLATRGYAVLDVNYRGSTGYGRAYMEALHGNWGLYDVEDAVSGAHHLAEQGLVDGDKLVIMGGSAGGLTVLQSLVTHPGVFKAGVCLYGVSNMFTLAADTHKFEERYLDSMLGPLPEASAIYRERSPIFQIDKLVDPIIVFQGEDDQVVPQAQADTIVESLRRRNVPQEFHLYPGEGHGWRKQETIDAYYTSLEAFLRNYVLFA